jgi:lipopolysaccharide assembly outer membrane protein LptD (OstA)
LKKPADGQSDKFVLWTEKKDFEADGNIKAWQEHQELLADKAIYKKEMDRLFIEGNVQVHRKDIKNEAKKDDLLSDSLVLWLTTKVYEAFGKVETTKKIDIDEERDKSRKEKEEQEAEKSESSQNQ